jgi:hypothetical protein
MKATPNLPVGKDKGSQSGCSMVETRNMVTLSVLPIEKHNVLYHSLHWTTHFEAGAATV